MSRTRHHRDAVSPRRYMQEAAARRPVLEGALWNLRDAIVDLVAR